MVANRQFHIPSSCSILILLFAALLVGCQPLSIDQFAPAPTRPVATATLWAYPAPAPTNEPVSYPTDAITGEILDGSSYYATPSPDESVQVLAAANADYKAPTKYEIEVKMSSDSIEAVQEIYVIVPGSEKPIRLGDDAGWVSPESVNEPYVSWYQFCTTSCKNFKQGLHVTSLLEGKDYFVAEVAGNGSNWSMVGWPWVAYLEATGASGIANLYVSNLETGESRIISKSTIIDSNSGRYFAINDGQIAWAETLGDVHSWTLHVMDLVSGKSEAVPDSVADIKGISVSAQLVTWWSGHWRGYDRDSGESFTIPILGSSGRDDWKSIREVETPSVHDRTITWSLELNGQLTGFTASVAPKNP